MILGLALGLSVPLTGGPWALAAVAPVLYALGWWIERRRRNAALVVWLLAPLAALSLLRVPGVVDLRAPLMLPVAILSWWPLMRSLGGRTPWLAGTLVAAATAAAVLLVLATPVAPALVSADIATRTQVLYMAAATLLVLAGIRAWPQRREHE